MPNEEAVVACNGSEPVAVQSFFALIVAVAAYFLVVLRITVAAVDIVRRLSASLCVAMTAACNRTCIIFGNYFNRMKESAHEMQLLCNSNSTQTALCGVQLEKKKGARQNSSQIKGIVIYFYVT